MVMPKVPDTMKKTKDRFKVVIITDRCRVEGEIHVRPGERLTDFMNATGGPFIAVTSASVHTLAEGGQSYSVDFLNLNRTSINVVFPVTHGT